MRFIIANFFSEKENRSALKMYSKDQRRAMAKICNQTDFNKRMMQSFSKRTEQAIAGCKVCSFSVRHIMSILGRGVAPPIGTEVSSFFTVVNGVPWILINTDNNLMEVTLIHESIHYDQWKRGDFKVIDSGVIWKGETYLNEDLAKLDTSGGSAESLKNMPWEIEAYAYQFTDMQIAHIRTYGEPEAKKNLEEVLVLAGRVCTMESVEQVTE